MVLPNNSRRVAEEFQFLSTEPILIILFNFYFYSEFDGCVRGLIITHKIFE
jgi:hypothetical protein